jgi:hypothetical protein
VPRRKTIEWWDVRSMKKYILLASCLTLALGATPNNRGSGEPRDGTPRFSEDSTWCAVGDTEAVCRLKLVGVGRNREAVITLDVLARRVFSCVAATGQVVAGYTEKVYIGSARQVFRAERDGSVESGVSGELEWEMARDEALMCPSGYTLVPGSEATETSWQLTAVGQKKAGMFNAAYTSM